MQTLLVLVGVTGAGKSTQLNNLKKEQGIKTLQPSTTRSAREDDNGQYHLLSRKDWNYDEFAWSITARHELYGMRYAQLESLLPGEIGITVFYPGELDKLHKFREGTSYEVITVGLDTISDYTEQLRRINKDERRDEGKALFESQLSVVRDCDVVLTGDDSTVFAAIKVILQIIRSRGVLDEGAIKALTKAGTLLKDCVQENIQPASYDLRVGDAVWCKGKQTTITAEEPFAIPPYSYVIVKARETAALPKLVIARYDVKVSLFVQGIILSNGPQVDPGYSGGLLCMLFNASDTNVGLRHGEHFATVEFLVTSKVTRGYAAQHQNQGDLAQFMSSSTFVGAGGTIIDKFKELEGAWEKFRNVFMVSGGALILAFLVAMFTFIVFNLNTKEQLRELTEKAEKAVSSLPNIQGRNPP